ncbi:MAG TPA: N-acetylmuramoyl-L-alanine amidase [Kofleriaceae bacterium]|nr:N-acetylmuramoyl-L-alanine amidase [Kofleriaceae bacterium]
MRRVCLVALALAGACSQASPHEPASAPAPVASPPVASQTVADAQPPAVVVDAAPPLAIVDAPIRWNAERERLTLAYRRRHVDPVAADVVITPRAIVLHHTGGGSAKATRTYFDNIRIEAERAQLAAAGAVNVSSHYLVDRDGTIYRLQPDTRFARHCIGLNHLAIGIENVGDGKRWPLTDAQVAANAALVRELAGRHEITHLLGHHEVMGFRSHAYFVEREPGYRNEKPDPGDAFMAQVRAKVADLELAGP